MRLSRVRSLLLCLSLASPLPAQVATISGIVRSVAGGPIANATVSISGTAYGATTRDDGGYVITVPASHATGQTVTLAARRVGFSPASTTLALNAGALQHDFVLTAVPFQLGEVIVTGAGTAQVRERVGSSINSVDSSALTRALQPQNLFSALAATAPNVRVNTQSGEPGGSAWIQIRGATSVTGTNQPLVVVDNQPIDNTTESTNGGNASTVTQNRAADINPNDVESIQILKGAAASAIYGARAANGVILITTKHGAPGQTRYTFTSTQGIDHVVKTFPLQSAYGQGTGGASGKCTALDCIASSLTWGPALDPGTPVFDHGSEIYHNGLTSDNAMSVSGGSGHTTFFASAGLTDQVGVIRGANNRYDRLTTRLSASQQLRTDLTVGGNFSYVNSRGAYVQKGSSGSSLLLGALRTPPDFNNQPALDPVSGLQRSYRFPNPSGASTFNSRGYDNPFFILANAGNRSELGRFVGNLNGQWTPAAWFAMNETIGADNYGDSRVESLPIGSSADPIGDVTRLTIDNLEIDHNLTATLSHSIGDRVEGRLVLGQNLNSRRNRQVYVFGEQLIAPTPYAIQNTVSYTPFESRSLIHVAAYFAQAEADAFDELHVTAGLRDDGFSTFGSSHRTALYPKIDAAWTLTRHLAGWPRLSWISNARLRAAYGETGREPPVYATLTALSSTAFFGSGFMDLLGTKQSGQGGLVSSLNVGNSDLRPERNREHEVGGDFGFFGTRADLSATYYDKRSSDVILSVPVNSAATGALTALVNGATVSNKGVELAMNVHPYTAHDVDVALGANYAKNRGRVLSLREGVQFVAYNSEGFVGSGGSSTVGYAPGVLRGQDWVRCGVGAQAAIPGSNGALVNVDSACGTAARRGAVYLSANGQPVVDPDQQVIADPNPKWTAGFNGRVRVGRAEFSTLFDLRRGGQVWDGTRGALDRFGTAQETVVRSEQGIFGRNVLPLESVAGPGAGVVAFKTLKDWQSWFTNLGGSASSVQSQFVEDGSFVKWREVSVVYSLTSTFVRNRLGFDAASVRLAGRNLHTWTKYKGLDPETNLGGAEFLTQGVDFFQNPQTRSFVVSINLTR